MAKEVDGGQSQIRVWDTDKRASIMSALRESRFSPSARNADIVSWMVDRTENKTDGS